MAAFSLFRGTNMAVVTSCENREFVAAVCFMFLIKKQRGGAGDF